MNALRLIGWLLILSSVFPVAPARGQVPLPDPPHDAAAAAAAPITEELLQRAPLEPTGALLARVQAVAADPRLGDPVRERALRDLAVRLGSAPPDPAVRPVLVFLAGYASRVLAPHPEGRDVASVPVYDVAAAARGTLHRWDRAIAEDLAGRALRQGRPEALIGLLSNGDPATLGGVLSAVRGAEARVLAELAPRVIGADAPAAATTPLAKAIGERLADPGLLGWVALEGASPWREQALRDLDRWLPMADAAAIWEACVDRSEAGAASIALIRLSTSPARPPNWNERLVTWLADAEKGPAAALALSRLPPAQARPALEKALADDDPVRVRRARLAIGASAHESIRALLHQSAPEALR